MRLSRPKADQLVESLRLSARSRGLGGACEAHPSAAKHHDLGSGRVLGRSTVQFVGTWSMYILLSV